MPTSQPLLLLSIAYAVSIGTIPSTCAFQQVTTSCLASNSKATTSTVSSGKHHHHHHHDVLGHKEFNPRRRGVVMFDSTKSENERTTRTTTTTKIMEELEVELYNEDGTEVDINTIGQIEEFDLETIEDDINEYYSAGGGGNEEVGDGGGKSKKKKLIECSASIVLPFSEDVAFDAFSDLTRQPSWCKYLHSVEYIGLVDENESKNNNDNTNIIPLRKSKWTVGVKGLRFSWTSKDTSISRPNCIEWESTSGMTNMGSVEFLPIQSATTTETQMIIRFTFAAPRVVSSLFRRSNKIRTYTEEVLLMNMLTDFRDVVMMEENTPSF